jgi:L-seryl-tRNA(Ser) seleniumtransferase
VSVTELVELARGRGIACLYDLGSGLLLDLSPWGLTGEPTLRQAVGSGADVVAASGDKLLGGPQAGLLIGTEAAIAACRADPLARALRADKLTLAALEATLALYRDPDVARREIPVLRMLTEDAAAVKKRAAGLGDLIEGESEVGGGSFPGAKLKTWLVATQETDTARLRAWDPPIIARMLDGRVVLDPRTILPDQVEMVKAALK